MCHVTVLYMTRYKAESTKQLMGPLPKETDSQMGVFEKVTIVDHLKSSILQSEEALSVKHTFLYLFASPQRQYIWK